MWCYIHAQFYVHDTVWFYMYNTIQYKLYTTERNDATPVDLVQC